MTLFDKRKLAKNGLVRIALQEVFGLGETQALAFCNHWGLGLDLRVNDVPVWLRTQRLRELDAGAGIFSERLETNVPIATEKTLRRVVGAALERLQVCNCYRGIRHLAGLPCNGQRTHTNGAKRLRVAKVKALQQKRLRAGKGKPRTRK